MSVRLIQGPATHRFMPRPPTTSAVSHQPSAISHQQDEEALSASFPSSEPRLAITLPLILPPIIPEALKRRLPSASHELHYKTAMDAAGSPVEPLRSEPTKSLSFSRFDSPRSQPQSRSRASTLQGGIPEIMLQPNSFSLSPERETFGENGDLFSKQDDEQADADDIGEVAGLPQRLEDLPIEIRSLTERFLESLSAKVHPTPLSIDTLSNMFQEFYARAESHIATHIATLSSRLSRDKSPAPSVSSRKSRALSRTASGTITPRNRSLSDTSKTTGEQQMVSASELLGRRRARKLLEVKRVALEEAVERAVCEKLYERLYHHRSTDDEERDQKLRSRIAALSVVGIGLKELLVTGTSEDLSAEVQKKVSEDEQQIKDWLAPARESLMKMHEAQHPAAKIVHLTAAHKGIVETLGKMFPASSSADEILPTLIYTLLTTPPFEINAISDLSFIQRFRAANKVDGESAYCLVNLEAAITFLETVDLPSLRKDERSEGPEKLSRPITPRVDSAPMQLGITPVKDLPLASSASPDSASDSAMAVSKPLPSPGKNPRRLSTLTQPFQSGAARIEAASDSFRNAVLDGADQTFEAINNTVENSFRFMFGRLKEQQQSKRAVGGTSISRANSLKGGGKDVAGKELESKETFVEMPKTLEDARKLVSPTTLSEDLFQPETNSKDDHSSLGGGERHEDTHSDNGPPSIAKSDSSSRTADLFGSRRQIRDRSADSSRSGLSGISTGSAQAKKVAFLNTTSDPLSVTSHDSSPSDSRFPPPPSRVPAAPAQPAPSPSPSNAAESIKGFGSGLNPFNRISAGVGGLFSRAGGAPSPGAATPTTPSAITASPEKDAAAPKSAELKDPPKDAVPVALTQKEANALTGIEELKKLVASSGGTNKFLDMKEAKDMKIREVDELLRAYQGLLASVRSVVDS